MQDSDIQIGGVYEVKISGKPARVRIDSEHENGGWVGTNLGTQRPVRIKNAKRLQQPVADDAHKASDQDKNRPAQRARKRVPRSEAKARVKASNVQSQKARTNAPSSKKRSSRSGTASQITSGGEGGGGTCLDAAVTVLREAGEPMTCTRMIERILEQGLWVTKGRTPAATLYSAILRQIQRKGDDARFKHVERGKFTLNG